MAPLLAAALPLLGDVVKRFIPDQEAQAEAERELARAAMNGELKSLEVRMSAIVMEAQSKDPWTSRARPSFLYVMYAYLLAAPLFAVAGLFAPDEAAKVPDLMAQWFGAIPGEMWALFGTGYLGYSVLRGKDKKMVTDLLKQTERS